MKEVCSKCGLDPSKKQNKGRQIYVCDTCGAKVCSDCSGMGASSNFAVVCREKCHAKDKAEGCDCMDCSIAGEPTH